LRQLRHPHIVETRTAGETRSGEPFLVMEWLPGKTLRDRIEESGPAPIEAVLRVGAQLASALSLAHGRAVVHRDLKPSNVMVVREDLKHVKLIDFGVARDADSQTNVTATGQILGTPGYLSPEQARADPVDARTDVFSLGVLMFELLTGRIPYEAESRIERLMAAVQQTALRLRAVQADAPEGLDDLLARMLASKPDDRPRDGGAVSAELERLGAPEVDLSPEGYLNGDPISITSTESHERASRRDWSRLGRNAIGGIALMAVGGFGAYLLMGPSPSKPAARVPATTATSTVPDASCPYARCEPLPARLQRLAPLSNVVAYADERISSIYPGATLVRIEGSLSGSGTIDITEEQERVELIFRRAERDAIAHFRLGYASFGELAISDPSLEPLTLPTRCGFTEALRRAPIVEADAIAFTLSRQAGRTVWRLGQGAKTRSVDASSCTLKP
ncbi:MAG: serine/threonine-protein kinase, partial [Myxococcota bacterium]